MARGRRVGDIADTVASVAGFIPGTPGHFISTGAGVIGEQSRVDEEHDRFRILGMKLRGAPSRAAKKKLESLDNRTSKVVTTGLVTIAGGAIGAMAGGALLGPMLGGILPYGMWIAGAAGSIGGGMLAGRIYDGTCEKDEQDAVNIAADCYGKCHDNGQPVSREEAFAQLVSVLPPKVQARYEDMLEKLAGTRDFREALQSKEGLKALTRMMKDSRLEELLRGSVQIPIDPSSEQHVAEQYAELINSGKLDPRAIILDPESVGKIASRHYRQQAVASNAMDYDDGVDVPQVPANTSRVKQRQEI